MDKKLLDYARSLTESDYKSLSQKALKVGEEFGELSKVVLPYDNASGTLHRFVDPEKILEECVDVTLCALSIAYELKFTDEQINQMLLKKLKVWGEKQLREEKVNSTDIPFEIHVTVTCPDILIPNFKNVCQECGVKPIVLDLQIGASGTIQDVMTSSTTFGTNKEAYDEMKRISNYLIANGYEVIREKIETVPWHPSAPMVSEDIMPKDCYFESHVAVTANTSNINKIREIAKSHGAHASKNKFKNIDDDNYVLMITLRAYDGYYEQFNLAVDKLIDEFHNNSIEVGKKIVEFSIYDTKVSHDAEWLTAES